MVNHWHDDKTVGELDVDTNCCLKVGNRYAQLLLCDNEILRIMIGLIALPTCHVNDPYEVDACAGEALVVGSLRPTLCFGCSPRQNFVDSTTHR